MHGSRLLFTFVVSLSKKHISGVICSVVETHTSRQFVLAVCFGNIGPVLKGEIVSLPSFSGEISCKKDIKYVKQGESFEF